MNKLIFGRVANIGVAEVDEDIENTLTFRDIIPYHLNNYKEPNIVNIYKGVCIFLEGSHDSNIRQNPVDKTYTFTNADFPKISTFWLPPAKCKGRCSFPLQWQVFRNKNSFERSFETFFSFEKFKKKSTHILFSKHKPTK